MQHTQPRSAMSIDMPCSSSGSPCSSTDSTVLLLGDAVKPSQQSMGYQFRPLLRIDLLSIQALCAESFPITYPVCWFDEVVSGGLISWGLFHPESGQLAAMMVAETKLLNHCNPEDREMLADAGAHVVYILSLAVSGRHRRRGLASRLLSQLFDMIVAKSPFPKAVFLHVLSTNQAAIEFYERNGFRHHDTLLNYYRLESSYGDGLTYVRYANGARPPLTISDICQSAASFLCFPVKALWKLTGLL